MNALVQVLGWLIFPGGLFLVLTALAYAWLDRKGLARVQQRAGPPWFQPAADLLKLLAKDPQMPSDADPWLYHALPYVALAGALTAALYLPSFGLTPQAGFSGDLVLVLYLLSLPGLTLIIAGANTRDRFAQLGASRTLLQRFAYEVPFFLALLGPALMAHSTQVGVIAAYAHVHLPLILTQPLGFALALLGLLGKLERPPFDAPEAHTELSAGTLTEYSGRGLALFTLARQIALVNGLTLISAFYLGGTAGPLAYFAQTLFLLALCIGIQALCARLRMDQVTQFWWRYGILLALAQWMMLALWGGLA